MNANERCNHCPGTVPGGGVSGQGPAGAQFLFVGEAPGRFGAGRTGVPFLGDEAGRRFERLLAEAGLSRGDVYITNAVRCLPLDAAGRNRRPSATEIAACAPALEREIAAIAPAVVVALGAVALQALAHIEPHHITLARGVATPIPWYGRTLVPLYHPGARAAIHRPWPQQVEDWRALLAMLPGALLTQS